jgi:hypothetical protein
MADNAGADGNSKTRSAAFWIISAYGFAVAALIFHRTKLVDHPEFVSFPKLLLAFAIWILLMAGAFVLSKAKPARFWLVFIGTFVLVCPVVFPIARWLLQRLPFTG